MLRVQAILVGVALFSAPAINFGQESEVPRLVKALNSNDVRIRVKAAIALGRLGESARPAVSRLAELLRAPDLKSRFVAEWAIEEIAPHFWNFPVPTFDEDNETVTYGGFTITSGQYVGRSPFYNVNVLNDRQTQSASVRIRHEGKSVSILWLPQSTKVTVVDLVDGKKVEMVFKDYWIMAAKSDVADRLFQVFDTKQKNGGIKGDFHFSGTGSSRAISRRIDRPGE